DAVTVTGYAETLRSMGRFDDALAAYEGAKVQFANDRVVTNAMACLLIDLNRLDEAKVLLLDENVIKLADWWDKHVLAMLYLREENFAEAEVLLLDGVKNAPLPKSQKMFKSALNLLRLKQNQASQVVENFALAEVIEFPADRIIYAHALAQTGEKEKAEQVLDGLGVQSAEVINLADYIRRRHLAKQQHSPQQAQELDDKIFALEVSMVMRAA
ncbi:MAG: putative Zn-dependent protease, partial [Alteromonadaceae bacterium]